MISDNKPHSLSIKSYNINVILIITIFEGLYYDWLTLNLFPCNQGQFFNLNALSNLDSQFFMDTHLNRTKYLNLWIISLIFYIFIFMTSLTSYSSHITLYSYTNALEICFHLFTYCLHTMLIKFITKSCIKADYRHVIDRL